MFRMIIFVSLLFSTTISAKGLMSKGIIDREIKQFGLNHVCSTVPNTQATYCITRTQGSTNPDVIYYFHCLFGDENNWLIIPQFHYIRQRWVEQNYMPPTVVTISYGPSWLVAPKGESEKSGLYEEIQNTIFPYLEKNKLNSTSKVPGKKILLGLSLGGPNSLEFFLHSPQKYAKVGLLCPALSNISPYASDDEVWDYIDRTGADPAHVMMALSIARDYFSPQDWEKNSPLKLATRSLPRGGAELLVFAGKSDSFGFYEGPLNFYNQARMSGGNATFLDNDAGHCFFPIAEVADFLSR